MINFNYRNIDISYEQSKNECDLTQDEEDTFIQF